MSSKAQVFLKDGSLAEATAREAQHLQILRGPGIVPLRDAGTRRLELEGAACSLADVLHERGPLPADEVRAVGAAAAEALAQVHMAGLVHGDVKPANLLLSHKGELWLADFDATAPAHGQPLNRSSPPRVPPGAPAWPAVDITALALTLVELVTGALLDPQVRWRAADLRRLGCSTLLSAEVAMMLDSQDQPGVTSTADSTEAKNVAMSQGSQPGNTGLALAASSIAEMFRRSGNGSLPEPVANPRRVDPTPTVEFMPARPTPPEPSPRPSPGTDHATRWWQRLAASWQPSSPSPGAGRPF